jgi:hypothetical protein
MIALLPGGHAADLKRQHGRHAQQDTANAFPVRAKIYFFNRLHFADSKRSAGCGTRRREMRSIEPLAFDLALVVNRVRVLTQRGSPGYETDRKRERKCLFLRIQSVAKARLFPQLNRKWQMSPSCMT